MTKCIIIYLCLWFLPKCLPSHLLIDIENQRIVSKSCLESVLNANLSGFDEKFQGIGDVLIGSNISAGVVRGIKNDTLFDVVVVFVKDKLAAFRSVPHALVSKREGKLREYFKLGRGYLSYNPTDTNCVRAFFETIEPYRVDTLNEEFYFGMAKRRSLDSLEFCQR